MKCAICKIKAVACILAGCFIIVGCASKSEPSTELRTVEPKLEVKADTTPAEPKDESKEEPKEEPRTVELGRGINIGNALDAPKDEFWGVEIKEEYFDIIAQAGFDTVRLPVRFSDYLNEADYQLDEDFLKRVDGYVDYGLSLGLNIILDLHHFMEMMDDPNACCTELNAIWRQLSKRYKDYPPELIFEILNEPQNNLGGELWNQYLKEVISIIRENNPDRLIVVGGERYNSLEGLEVLSLPKDENLIVTFHYYVPTEFTFQGNPYHAGYEHLRDIRWTANDGELARIRDDFEKVRAYAERNGVKVLLGEFGAVNTIPFEYRGKWTEAVVTIAEEMGFSWCYWELCSWFGILDANTMQWDQDMLSVLLHD